MKLLEIPWNRIHFQPTQNSEIFKNLLLYRFRIQIKFASIWINVWDHCNAPAQVRSHASTNHRRQQGSFHAERDLARQIEHRRARIARCASLRGTSGFFTANSTVARGDRGWKTERRRGEKRCARTERNATGPTRALIMPTDWRRGEREKKRTRFTVRWTGM